MRALEKAVFRVARQGKHVVMTDGTRILTMLWGTLATGGIRLRRLDGYTTLTPAALPQAA